MTHAHAPEARKTSLALQVTIFVLLAVAGCYMLVRHQLRSQVDGSLWAQEREVQLTSHVGSAPPGIPASAGGPAQYVQFVYQGGFHNSLGGLTLPVTLIVEARAAIERLVRS